MSVETTRSTPLYSDIAHWLSRKPGTEPLPRYVVFAGSEMSNSWICVEAFDCGCTGLTGSGRTDHCSVETKSAVGEA